MKHMLLLPDGRVLSSGADALGAVEQVQLRRSVADRIRPEPGAVCCACLEMTFRRFVNLAPGTQVVLQREVDGVVSTVGTFLLDIPRYPLPNNTRIIAYDRLILLDKDLSAFLESYSFPCSLLTFAKDVCSACGLTLTNNTIPNGAYTVEAFSRDTVTGRQLMRWVGQLCGRFLRCDPMGNAELAWYTQGGALAPQGERFYYGGSLTLENYRCTPCTVVQLHPEGSPVGYLWPMLGGGLNGYAISGNPLMPQLNDETKAAMTVIAGELAGLPAYAPCRFEVPLYLDISPGTWLSMTDASGAPFTALVMTTTQRGHRLRVECTGEPTNGSAGDHPDAAG